MTDRRREREISLVHRGLYARVQEVDEVCDAEGVDILFYCGLRTPQRQAELYRAGRSLAAIERKAKQLEALGYEGLAALLMGTPPQPGRSGSKTCAAPGESWHQYGLAVDAAPITWRGKRMVCLWDTRRYAREWNIYGSAAGKAGLTWAGDWTYFREFPHIQMTRPGARNPLKTLDRDHVRNALRKFNVEAF